jgi:hypothetical protein
MRTLALLARGSCWCEPGAAVHVCQVQDQAISPSARPRSACRSARRHRASEQRLGHYLRRPRRLRPDNRRSDRVHAGRAQHPSTVTTLAPDPPLTSRHRDNRLSTARDRGDLGSPFGPVRSVAALLDVCHRNRSAAGASGPVPIRGRGRRSGRTGRPSVVRRCLRWSRRCCGSDESPRCVRWRATPRTPRGRACWRTVHPDRLRTHRRAIERTAYSGECPASARRR